MSAPPRVKIPGDFGTPPKLPQSDSPASSTGIPANRIQSIPSFPLVHASTPAAVAPSPLLRPGSIVKRPIKSGSSVKSAPRYRMRERSGASQGKWVFIVNATKLKKWEELSPKLLKQLSSVEWRVHITQGKGHARKLAERAALRNADLIAAVGGDGTLNEVVDGIMRAGVMGEDGLPRAVVTVLPLGSASDFHRSMAWEPNNFEDAMWRIGKRGSTAILDVARLQCEGPDGPVDRHFINVASCGASAKAALKVDKWRWAGSTAAYRLAALGALSKYHSRTLGVRIDGGEWEKISGATMVAIGNGSYFGNGFNIAPDANPYDGQLQVVTAQRMGMLDFMFKSWRLKMGKHLELKGFTAREGATVEVAPWKSRRAEPSMLEFHFDTPVIREAPSPVESTTPEGSFTTMTRRHASDDSAMAANGPPRARVPMADSEGSDVGSESSGRSRSTVASSMKRGGIVTGSKGGVGAAAAAAGEKKEKEPDYGPIPVEIDGEVVGWAPFAVTVIPGAIKFRV